MMKYILLAISISASLLGMKELSQQKQVNILSVVPLEIWGIIFENYPGIYEPKNHKFIFVSKNFNKIFKHTLDGIIINYYTDNKKVEINFIFSFPNLKNLTLSSIDFKEEDLIDLTKIKGLQSLQLSQCNISNENFRYLSNLTQLKDIKFSLHGINDDGFLHLSGLNNISSMNLTFLDITDEVFKHFSNTKLKNLNIELTHLGENDLKYLSKFSNLERLEISQCEYTTTDKMFENLSSLTNISVLTLTNEGYKPEITDNAFKYLCALTNLKSLELSDCENITDQGFYHLAALSKLEKAIFHKLDNITDRTITTLAMLTMLQELELCWPQKLSDQGIGHLSNLINLKVLVIKSEQLTYNAFIYLTNLTNLKKVSLRK